MTQSSIQPNGNGAADAASSRDAEGSEQPLTGISTEDLRQELVRRQKRLNALLSQRDKLARQLGDVEAEIATLGGSAVSMNAMSQRPAAAAGAPRRTRAHNDVSLPDAIAMAVEVRATVTPAEAADLVKANGYQTTARNFGILVAHTLAKDPRFKRVERGRYERVS